jgi:hypothetical protein
MSWFFGIVFMRFAGLAGCVVWGGASGAGAGVLLEIACLVGHVDSSGEWRLAERPSGGGVEDGVSGELVGGGLFELRGDRGRPVCGRLARLLGLGVRPRWRIHL